MGEVIMTDRPSFTNQQINTIVPNGKIEPSFLYYSLRPRKQELLALGATTGVRTPILNKSAFSDLTIKVPPLNVQRRIAGILSAYDDLIENNQRRIKILEAMARSLYREWFVNFRFPGHEKVPLVDSPLGPIPKGWEFSEFRDLFNIRYGKTLPKTEILDSGPYPVYGAGDVIGFYDKMLCPDKCALVTSRGNGSGTVWRTREPAFVTNNSLIMLPLEQYRHWDYSFVELLLRQANVMEAKTGSAQPQVTIENLNYVKAIVPAKELVVEFCTFATPVYEQVDSLLRQIDNLRRTRDLLLPRLLSGAIFPD
jgi:type I restriction enzyme S subunit